MSTSLVLMDWRAAGSEGCVYCVFGLGGCRAEAAGLAASSLDKLVTGMAGCMPALCCCRIRLPLEDLQLLGGGGEGIICARWIASVRYILADPTCCCHQLPWPWLLAGGGSTARALHIRVYMKQLWQGMYTTRVHI